MVKRERRRSDRNGGARIALNQQPAFQTGPPPIPLPAHRLMIGRGGRLTLMGFCEAPFSPLPRLLGAKFGTLATICLGTEL